MAERMPTEDYAELCRYILKRDKWMCRHCGMRNNLHVHHIVFRSAGGPDEDWNLLVLCMSCHDGIHTNVEDGVPGLKIVLPANAEESVTFERRWNWQPE